MNGTICEMNKEIKWTTNEASSCSPIIETIPSLPLIVPFHSKHSFHSTTSLAIRKPNKYRTLKYVNAIKTFYWHHKIELSFILVNPDKDKNRNIPLLESSSWSEIIEWSKFKINL